MNSGFSKASSAAQRLPDTVGPVVKHAGYNHIGRGQCGTIYEETGTSYVLTRANRDENHLWNNYRVHTKVYESLHKISTLVKVPIPSYYIKSNEDDDWWSENLTRFPEGVRSRSDILRSQRIMPLPTKIRDALIDEYCPSDRDPEAQKRHRANKACLVMVYLGQRRDPSRRIRFFTLRNFILHADQIQALGIEAKALAASMGEALGMMHWIAKIDANDVEFVLGSRPIEIPEVPMPFEALGSKPTSTRVQVTQQDFKNRPMHLWLLDLNLCHEITMDDNGIQKAVDQGWQQSVQFSLRPKLN